MFVLYFNMSEYKMQDISVEEKFGRRFGHVWGRTDEDIWLFIYHFTFQRIEWYIIVVAFEDHTSPSVCGCTVHFHCMFAGKGWMEGRTDWPWGMGRSFQRWKGWSTSWTQRSCRLLAGQFDWRSPWAKLPSLQLGGMKNILTEVDLIGNYHL